MRLDRFLPSPLRKLGPEALRFAAVGGMNTIINFVVLNALVLSIFKNGELKANVVATAVATITSYLMNRHWTYRDRPSNAVAREFTLFVLFNVAGLAIELAVMGLTKYWFGLTALLAINAAKFVGMVLGTVFRFLTYRTFVFTAAPEVAAAMATGADAELGPMHVHLDSVEELLDAEAAASALAGVPVPAQLHPSSTGRTSSAEPLARQAGSKDDFDKLTAPLEAQLLEAELLEAEFALNAERTAPRSER